MAEQQKTTTQTEQGKTPGQTSQPTGEERNVGTNEPEAYASSDQSLGDGASISEGEVHALRADAGLNQGAGHESDVHAWSVSPAGKAFKKGASDRDKAAKAEAKAFEEQVSKDGMTEAEVAYQDAVKKA